MFQSGACARLEMILAFGIVLFACASATADKSDYKNILNNTNIDKRVLNRLSTIINSNKTINLDDLDKNLVSKLRSLVNETVEAQVLTKLREDGAITHYDDTGHSGDRGLPPANIPTIEESPAYASSVVLASDLLSLTSAIANVEDRICREQGYRFLDGLLMNKRWALRSKYLEYTYFLLLYHTLPLHYLSGCIKTNFPCTLS